MAINFPNSPVANVTTYTSGTTTWQWDGTVWNVISDPGFASEDYVDNALTGLATEDYVDTAVGNAALAGLDAFDNEDFFAKMQASEPVLDQHVFYVSPDGTDSAELDGRRTDTAWRTIGYALEQVPENSTVLVRNGTYLEQLPLRVPSNVAVIGESMRTTIVEPAEGLDRNDNPNNQSTMWLLNDGCLLKNMTFNGLTGFTTGLAPADVSSYTAQGVFIALDPDNPIIVKSPYVVECSAFSTGGVGAVVDGSLHASGNKSMLFHGYTNLHDNGVGFWVKNGGKAEIVSCFTYFCHVGYLTSSGGQIRALNGNCSYGLYGALSSGFDPTETPITGTLLGDQLTWDPLTLVGSFAEGETIIGATSGARGVITEVQLSSDKLYYTTTSGVFQNGEVIELEDETASAQLLAEGGVTGQKGFVLVVDNLTSRPIPGTSVSFTGTGVDAGSYVVRAVSGTYVDASSVIILALANEKVEPSAGGTALVVRRAFSQTRLTGHDFLNIGTGGVTTTNYPGTPTQAPSQGNEIIEQRPGRVYYVSTDQDGNFRVGGFFRVNQATGVATLNASAFDLSGLNSLRLGAVGAQLGELINEFSSDKTLSSNSNEKVPTEAAVRGYFENISTDVVPNTSITYDLGKTDKRWKDLWSSTVTTSNLTFTGTGNRITGNFGSGTVNTRIVFQSSSSNTQTNIVAVENGTVPNGNGAAQLVVAESGYATNGDAATGSFLIVKNTDLRIASGILNSGTYLPLTFYNGGSEAMRIDTSGNVGIGTTNPTIPLQIVKNQDTEGSLLEVQNLSSTGRPSISVRSEVVSAVLTAAGSAWSGGAELGRTNGIALFTTSNATGGISIAARNASGIITMHTGGADERMRINSEGNVRVGASDTALGSINTVNTFGFKNRIINGDMRIDQRNAGATVTPTSVGTYTLDRWRVWEETDGTATVQQSSVAPTGFTNSLLWTTTSADSSLDSGQYALIGQVIEGLNIADLGWGTANAQTVTLSFWVRSSLTGTFSGSFVNGAFNRSYAFTYTISSANTWEQKSITIAGDTTGTWLTTNGTGIRLYFGLGVGSNFIGTAGAWATALSFSATGATSVVGTNGATFYITGVQLEKGSTATSFDYRPYGTELALCQRYFQRYEGINGCAYAIGQAYSTTAALYSFKPIVVMRAAPTLSSLSVATWNSIGNALALTTFSIAGTSTNSVFRLDANVSSGLTAGNASGLHSSANNSFIAFSAEL